MAAPTSEKSRLRLIVVQALVFSLFATLFGRLWFLQVASGEDYQAKAASQSVREIVVQPDRGLIVDAQGRPLVANRSSWVVSVDRTVLGKMAADERATVVRRVARAVDVRPGAIRARLLNCGDDGSISGKCWNGSPYQPVPVATDVAQKVALRILEQGEDYPAVVADQAVGARLPRALRHQRRAPARLPQPDHRGRAGQPPSRTPTSPSTAPPRSAGPASRSPTTAGCAGMPGYQRVGVDSMGRVLGEDSLDTGRPGDTLVTSLDARVQAVVEKQLALTIKTARATTDPVTKRKYAADSGAAVVIEAKTGRVVAMASQPTYDPGVWVSGITKKQLAHLYSEKAGTPLLSRATQGQFAPGSTWKPMMTAGALTHGYTTDTRLNCSSAFQVGNRAFKNYESGAYGFIGFDKALEVSCNTFFYRVGYDFWRRYGSDVSNVNARDPLVEEAQAFGFGKETGIDLPGEASGRIADRDWKLGYYKAQKDYYCKLAANPPANASDFLRRFSREFCIEGYAYRAGDAVNFAIGQGDTIVTPLQLARAYGALSNGGTLYEPRVGKAIVDPDGRIVKRIPPKVQAKVGVPQKTIDYIDAALQGRHPAGHHVLADDRLPARRRAGSAPRRAPPRSTASSRRRGWRPTPRTTSW